jgi:DNA-binding CsgD family transcriptional regulator
MDGEDRAEGSLLQLIGDVCGLLDLDELRHGLLEALNRALPSDYVSLNDVGPSPDQIVTIMRPEVPDLVPVWERLAHENPLLRRVLRTLDGRAYRFSDVITQEDLHELPLYRELYAPLKVEYQLAFNLPACGDRVLAIALSRGDRDYSDAERDFANRARPFLIQAYLNAIAHDALRARTVHGPAPLIEPLLAQGLTPREAEVMRLLARGSSNDHIGADLGISARTVGKHLERAFRKLGVVDRSTAAGRAWQLGGSGADGSGPGPARDGELLLDSPAVRSRP